MDVTESNFEAAVIDRSKADLFELGDRTKAEYVARKRTTCSSNAINSRPNRQPHRSRGSVSACSPSSTTGQP